MLNAGCEYYWRFQKKSFSWGTGGMCIYVVKGERKERKRREGGDKKEGMYVWPEPGLIGQ